MTNVWNRILTEFSGKPRDVKTAPKDKSKALWFYAYADGRDVYVKNAENHEKSCSIRGKRRLEANNTDKIYEYYMKFKAKTIRREDLTEITQNSSYWIGIFEELGI